MCLLAAGVAPADGAGYAESQTGCGNSLRYVSPDRTAPCPVSPTAGAGPNTKGQLNRHGFNSVSFDSPTDGWAVGQWFGTGSGGRGLTLIRHWNGKAWRVVASPSPQLGGSLAAVSAISPTDAWAVGTAADGGEDIGQPLIEHWDGKSWSIVDVGAEIAVLHGVAALGPDDVWAVGMALDQQTGIYSTFVLHWDGSSWSRQNAPSIGKYPALGAVVVISADDVWAVGASPLIEHWDGQTWTLDPQPSNTGYRLAGLTATGPDDVWAVGWAGPPYHVVTAHWNGSGWAWVAAPDGPQDSGQLHSVSAVGPDDVWAVGSRGTRTTGTKTLIDHWDGATWSRVASPNRTRLADQPNTLMSVAALAPDQAWAVGSFGLSIYKAKSIIDQWDGDQWTNYLANH